jgi:hypothetical protein
MGVDDPPPAYDSIVGDICAQTDEVREGTMFPGRNVSEQERRHFLGTLDLPPGVQEAILESCSNFPSPPRAEVREKVRGEYRV